MERGLAGQFENKSFFFGFLINKTRSFRFVQSDILSGHHNLGENRLT